MTENFLCEEKCWQTRGDKNKNVIKIHWNYIWLHYNTNSVATSAKWITSLYNKHSHAHCRLVCNIRKPTIKQKMKIKIKWKFLEKSHKWMSCTNINKKWFASTSMMECDIKITLHHSLFECTFLMALCDKFVCEFADKTQNLIIILNSSYCYFYTWCNDKNLD